MDLSLDGILIIMSVSVRLRTRDIPVSRVSPALAGPDPALGGPGKYRFYVKAVHVISGL